MPTQTHIKPQTYKNYKPSGVEWLGDIPEHWEVDKFKYILSQNKGLTITKQNLTDTGIFCVNYGEIHSKYGFELDTNKHELKCVDPEFLVSDENALLNLGDFIFADTSEDIEGSGNFTHLRSKDEIFAGYHTIIARPRKEILSLFLAFVFDSISYRNQIRKKVKGVKVYSITQAVLKDTNIWFPPLPEQKAIANFLDDKTQKIDQAIAIKEKQINLFKERKQIIIHKLVTGQLVKNGDAWTEPTEVKDSGVEWIGEIPKHWEVKKVKHVAEVVLGKMLCNDDKGNYQLKPYLKSKNIQWLNVDISSVEEMWFSQKEMKEYSLKKGDLVLSEGGEVGKTCIWNNELEECYIQNSAHKLTFSKDSISKYYLYLFFMLGKAGVFDSIVNRVSIAHLTKDKLTNVEIVKPPLSEQKQISSYIESASQKIESAISIKQQEIAQLKEYKSSLINSVVTGKVRVC